MACKICGKNSCTECFHSIEEQQEYERVYGAIDELKDEIRRLKKENSILWGYVPDENINEVEERINKL